MQCLPCIGSMIAPPPRPGRGSPHQQESTGAAGKRAAEEGRTPKADVMHPTHGCCGRESRRFPPVFVSTVRQSLWHTSSAGGSHAGSPFDLSDCSSLDRKSAVWRKSWSVRVDLGVRRLFKKKK